MKDLVLTVVFVAIFLMATGLTNIEPIFKPFGKPISTASRLEF